MPKLGASLQPALTSRRFLTQRILLASVVGIVTCLLAWAKLRAAGPYALGLDFTGHWRAADAFRHGYSPYLVVNGFSRFYPFNGGYPNLLPTVILQLPFAYLPMQVAMPVFTGISVAVFTFAISRDGWWRLPFLLSLPLYSGAMAGQSVPLVTAAMLIPSLAFLAPMKYTIGAAGAAYTLSLRYVIIAVSVVLVSIVIWPWWPMQWFAELDDVVGGPYWHLPLRVTGGAILLLAALRWRRPEGRLLLVMSCVPQTMLYYDQLPLLLAAQTYRQAILFSVASWVPALVSIVLHGSEPFDRATLFAFNAPIILVCYYVPLLVVILRRPNEGTMPRWLRKREAVSL
jgi:hypothetical protein